MMKIVLVNLRWRNKNNIIFFLQNRHLIFLESLSPNSITVELKFQHMDFEGPQTLIPEAQLLLCGSYGDPCAHR